MIIIWGTKTRQERLGTVADWCPACRNVQVFTVTSYYRVGHIYYIPLGRGSRVATVRECWECGSQYHAEEEDYDDFLPEDSAEQMSISKLIRLTNPSLQERLRPQNQEQPQSRARPNSGNRSTEVLDALPADDDDAAGT